MTYKRSYLLSDIMTKRIAMVTGKGGVGKTTCSLLVAAALQDNGFDVVLDDRDPQRSATFLAPNMGLRIGTEAAFVVIDTPPNVENPAMLDAVRTADVVVLITSPSPSDMSTTAATAETIKRERHKKTVVLINKVRSNTILSREVEHTAGLLPFERLKNSLADRQNYQKAQLHGWKALSKLEQNEMLKVALEIMA